MWFSKVIRLLVPERIALRPGNDAKSPQEGTVGAIDLLGARSRSDYEIQAVGVGTPLELEK